MTERENYLRTATFQGGEWLPTAVGISPTSWLQLREELENVAASPSAALSRPQEGPARL